MHRDLLRDIAQDQRAQVANAVEEELLLPAHDLGGNLDDGVGALLERFHQPARGLEAFGEVGLLLAVAGADEGAGVEAAVDQNARQCLRVQFQYPAAIRRPAHQHIGDQRRWRGCAVIRPRLRVKAADFSHHLREVGGIDAADFLQQAQLAPSQKRQVRQ